MEDGKGREQRRVYIGKRKLTSEKKTKAIINK